MKVKTWWPIIIVGIILCIALFIMIYPNLNMARIINNLMVSGS